jgi:hypothetical protein
MEGHPSTREVGWILGRSAGTLWDMIVAGEIEATRTVEVYRIAKAKALRTWPRTARSQAGGKLSERDLERLIDQMIETNEAATK